MKYILKILVLLFSLSVFAQQPPRGMDSEREKRPNNRMEAMKALTPEQEATLWTKKMTLELDLNQNQQDQMYALILGKTKKIKSRMENKPKERPSKEEIYNMHISRLDEAIAMKESLKKILNDDQFAKWELMKNKKPSNTKDIKKRSKMKKEKRR
jgi:Spy/CpxP family protein refolding chaperone